MRVAVVGHVEWADVVHVDLMPRAGEWTESSWLRAEPAGAGATAARQLARLAGRASFYTALTDDELSRRARAELAGYDVDVHAQIHVGQPQRRAIVVVDASTERTIIVHGSKLCPLGKDDLPWHALDDYDGACFVCGDTGSLVEARRARVLVATARWLPLLRQSNVPLDALVQSATDPDEQYTPGDLDPPPELVVTTAGAEGGTYAVQGEPERPFQPAGLSFDPVDSYGAGDSFIAGLTFGLARGDKPEAALELAAQCGASVIGARGISDQLRTEANPSGP